MEQGSCGISLQICGGSVPLLLVSVDSKNHQHRFWHHVFECLSYIDLNFCSQRRNMISCPQKAAGRHAVAGHHAVAEAAPTAAEGGMARALERFVGMPSNGGPESTRLEARLSSSSSSSDISANWQSQVSVHGHETYSGFCCARNTASLPWRGLLGSTRKHD